MALTENDVVQAVAEYLSRNGYRIERALSTTEQGTDIVAEHSRTGRRMLVEAKGSTSSKAGTNRYGKGFTANQAKSHVAVALYCGACLHQTAEAENADIALAFPDDVTHRKLVEKISKALDALNVTVFFVSEDKVVSVVPATESTRQPAIDGVAK